MGLGLDLEEALEAPPGMAVATFVAGLLLGILIGVVIMAALIAAGRRRD